MAVTEEAGWYVHDATDLAEKVAALACADIYDATARSGENKPGITCIETHMSWVFLTQRFAYKLKKPIRSSFLDFSTLAAREHYCREELRLNRRLAPSVYLDVVPLRRSGGRLQLDGASGEIVDYLIKMMRLPAEKMLEHALVAHTLRRTDLRAVATALAEFYRRADKTPMTPARYRARFAAAIYENRAQLTVPHYDLPGVRIAHIAAMQLDYAATAEELATRAARVVDAHGDLRPEHICLSAPLQFLDCLEFQSELRQLDPFDELAFLALECARLGAPSAGSALLRMYRVLSGDQASPMLIAFYQSHRAMVRAVLAIWHLDNPAVRDRVHWYQRTLTYIDIAEHAIERALPIGIGSSRVNR